MEYPTNVYNLNEKIVKAAKRGKSMVNDDNDKWSDNGDLPINPGHNSGQLEEEQPKKKVLKDKIDNQKGVPIEKLENGSKYKEEPIIYIANNERKVIKNQTNDQKEMSMEELMNSSRRKEMQTENLTHASTRHNAKVYTRKDSAKNIADTPEKSDIKIYTREESTKDSTKNVKPKEEPLANVSTKEIATLDDIQKLKDQLKKLKDETKEPQYIKDLTKYIKNLDSNVGQLSSSLKTFTDAKSWEAISRGRLEARKYANYYDVRGTITTATTSDPHDFDSAAYNVERIFESLERFAEIIYVANDGTDNLYVIVSHGGRTRFSTEAIVYPGECKCYFNTYEIRLRSPTAGLPYRVTEYCINNISEISSIPIEKANIHNDVLPAINTNWIATDITPTNYPTTFMIEVAVSIAGNFSAVVTNGGNAQTVMFNVVSGPALVAGGVYIFNLLVHNGDSVNFIYSTTGGTIQILRVQELDSASA